MIQSVKFDSPDMDIKNISSSVLTFIIKRLIEIAGITVSLMVYYCLSHFYLIHLTIQILFFHKIMKLKIYWVLEEVTYLTYFFNQLVLFRI